jgi:hypothetical protein
MSLHAILHALFIALLVCLMGAHTLMDKNNNNESPLEHAETITDLDAYSRVNIIADLYKEGKIENLDVNSLLAFKSGKECEQTLRLIHKNMLAQFGPDSAEIDDDFNLTLKGTQGGVTTLSPCLKTSNADSVNLRNDDNPQS